MRQGLQPLVEFINQETWWIHRLKELLHRFHETTIHLLDPPLAIALRLLVAIRVPICLHRRSVGIVALRTVVRGRGGSLGTISTWKWMEVPRRLMLWRWLRVLCVVGDLVLLLLLQLLLLLLQLLQLLLLQQLLLLLLLLPLLLLLLLLPATKTGFAAFSTTRFAATLVATKASLSAALLAALLVLLLATLLLHLAEAGGS